MLTTWSAVHDHLAATYEGLVRDAAQLAFAIAVPPTPTEPAQRIELVVRRIDDLDGRWIAVSSVVGSPRLLSLADVLAGGARLVIGAPCTQDGRLALRQLLPLDRLDAADLDETVRALAQATLIFRARLRELGDDAVR